MLAVGFPAGFQEATFAAGISLPTDMVFAPDGRLFVTEKAGSVRVVENGVLLNDPFLTVPATTEVDRGLLGIAFDPNFETNGFVYIYYTRSDAGVITNRLSRFTVSNYDENVADPASELAILDGIPMIAVTHAGGGMGFGTDGMLYLGIGDGGQIGASQDMSSLLGKLVRIDVSNYPNIIPADNPFVGTPGVREEIYASGLRQPFKLDIDVNNRVWVADVGVDSFEEINEAQPGANFGWPLYEGISGDPNFDDPVYAYAHTSAGGAITSTAFYQGNLFPTEYEGDFFFADLPNQVIRRIDLDQGQISSVTDFATGVGGPVDIEIGPDGALYYLEIFTGNVVRVEYVGGSNRTPEAIATSNVIYGDSPLTVAFDGSLSSDPDGDNLFYSWDFGDGFPPMPGVSVVHTYATSGIYTATLTVTDGNGGEDISDSILIAVDESPPVGQINVFPENPLFQGGDTIAFSGSAFDLEDGVLGPSAFSWNVMLRHDTHVHPVLGPLNGVTGGSFEVPVIGENSANVSYRFNLTVTDSAGLTSTSFVDVFPQVTQVTLDTNSGLPDLLLGGTIVSAPVVFNGVAGILRTIEAPLLQQKDGVTYIFDSWSDGGSIQHTIATPVSATTFTANYQTVAPDRAAASYFVAGLYEKLLQRVADPGGLAFQVDRLMAGESPLNIIQSMWESAENRTLQVIELYSEFLDRVPTAGEINSWVAQFNTGVTEIEAARTILSSSEFISQGNTAPEAYVTALYNLVFKRSGTSAEIQFWVGTLDSGVAHYDVANAFLTAGERYNVMLDRYFNAYLDRPLAPSEAIGDLHAASATPLQDVGLSVLNSQEFLTNQAARPVVVALYDNVLQRTAADVEIDFWVNQLLAGTTRQTVATSFDQSVEGVGVFVTETYFTILERLPAAAERDFWVAQIVGGATEQDVLNSFFTSSEYNALYPDDSGFVSSLYEKILGRPADPAGLASWVQALQSGATRAAVVSTFFSTPEYRARVIIDVYAEFLGRIPVANEIAFWTSNLPTDGTIAATLRTNVLSSDEYYRTAEVRMVFATGSGSLLATTGLSDETFVTALYVDVLERSAAQIEVDIWTAQLAAGVSRLTVTSQIWDSPERASLVASDLYSELLGRAPTAQEIADVTTLLGTGGQTVDAAFDVFTSNEYNALYVPNVTLVDAFYADVLKRVATAVENQMWSSQLDSGTPRAVVVSAFQNSTEAWNNLIDAAYDDYLGQDPTATVAAGWLANLSTGAQNERDLALTLLSSDEYYALQSP